MMIWWLIAGSVAFAQEPGSVPRATQPGSLERFSALTTAASPMVAAWELEKAEPLLDEALQIASGLGPAQESAAHFNLALLYEEYAKRDGKLWDRLTVPHFKKAVDLSAEGSAAQGIQVRYILSLLRNSDPAFKQDVAPLFETFLKAFVAERETSKGPLNPETFPAYQALALLADGSDGQAQALHACALIAVREDSAIPEAAIPLLADCAPHSLEAARLVKRLATARGKRWTYEAVIGGISEAELLGKTGDADAALSSIDIAQPLAEGSLDPGHSIRHRLLETRADLLKKAHRTKLESEARRQLKALKFTKRSWASRNRIQAPQVIKQVEPAYTRQAIDTGAQGTCLAFLIVDTNGSGSLVAIVPRLPAGLHTSAAEAFPKWKFRPYLKDGKPVDGLAMIEISFRPKS
jgi:hypothetical protein